MTTYLNDILIYSRTLAKHEQHVKTVLDCLKKRNLRLKSKKCEFHKKKIVYLKYVISKTRIFIKSVKLNVIKEWKKLTNVKKIQNFIDFVNYNRKFIKKISWITKSFIELTKNNVAWQWKKIEEKIFQQLKKTCFKKSILKMFDSTKSKRIEFDASDLIIKTCYNQCHEENWHFIIYLLKKLSSAEQNYDVHDKKLLVIIAVLENWRVYAKEISKLTILTNHKNLLHFIIIK